MTILLIVIIIFGFCYLSLASRVAETFRKNKIVPDILYKSPQEGIQITYPSGVSVNYGNELTPFSAKDTPQVKWRADENKLYTLLMVDPDAPSRANATYRSLRHWTVLNIPGCAIENGKTIAEYLTPAPSNGTGYHRYVYLVFEQFNGLIEYNQPIISADSVQHRYNFDVEIFARNFSLCEPNFGNFFRAKYDAYVPIVLARLGLTK